MSSVSRFCRHCGTANPSKNRTCSVCQQARPMTGDDLHQPSFLQGGYCLTAHIGTGGFSSVERAEDTVTGRSVAIKCISLVDAPIAHPSTVQIWTLQRRLHHYQTQVISDIAWSSHGNYIAIGGVELDIWDSSQDNHLVASESPHGEVTTLAWSPNGQYIATATDYRETASGSSGYEIDLWDGATYQFLRTYSGHQSQVTSLSWSPDSRRVVSSDQNGVVKVWDSATGKDLLTYQGHRQAQSVNTVRWSPDGHSIASGGDDTTVQAWEAATGKTSYVYLGQSGSITSLSWSPDSQHIVSCNDDFINSTVQIWEAATGKPFAFPYVGHGGQVVWVAWSPDGKYIASVGSDDQTVQIWTPQA